MIKQKWINTQFQSSTVKTNQFKSFARDYKKTLKGLLGDNFEMLSTTTGHFFLSGFVKNKATDKLVYWSIPDVRFFPGEWYNNILVRTAEHDKDYTGGANISATLDNLKGQALNLTK